MTTDWRCLDLSISEAVNTRIPLKLSRNRYGIYSIYMPYLFSIKWSFGIVLLSLALCPRLSIRNWTTLPTAFLASSITRSPERKCLRGWCGEIKFLWWLFWKLANPCHNMKERPQIAVSVKKTVKGFIPPFCCPHPRKRFPLFRGSRYNVVRLMDEWGTRKRKRDRVRVPLTWIN